MLCFMFILPHIELPTQRQKNVNMSVNKMKWDKIKWICWWRVTLLHFVCEGGFLVFSTINCSFIRNSVLSFCWHVLILKRYSFFEQASFRREKGITPQSIKEKEIFSFLISLSFPLSPSSSTQNPEFFSDTKSWV